MTLYTINRLVHRYGERTILRIESLVIEPGEIFALVGPSGAGKSTLLRLMAMLETPSQGQVTMQINGRAVTSATASIEDRRKIAMVFQRPVLLSRSVRANVAYGLRIRGQRDTTRRVEQALERVSLAHLSGAKAQILSGGEMQRVAVARALVLEPDVLLLDEPTANLDIQHQIGVLGLVRELIEQDRLGAVAAVHDLELAARFCDRLVLLHRGAVLAEGAPEHVLAPDHIRAAYGVTTRAYPDPITGFLRLAVLDNGTVPQRITRDGVPVRG